jgi:Fur family ferric uptake transcriptional regulator
LHLHPNRNSVSCEYAVSSHTREGGFTVTLSPASPAVAVQSVDAAVDAMRARGLRVSAARRLVLEALFAAEGPVSAEWIARGVVGRVPRSDLASVYRNLEVLEGLGIVRHVHLGHGPGLYALAGETEREYLVCESCAAVRTVPSSELDGIRAEIHESYGFHARFGHFPIVGFCPACAADDDGR